MKVFLLILVFGILGCSDLGNESGVKKKTSPPKPKVTGDIRTESFPKQERLQSSKAIRCDQSFDLSQVSKTNSKYSWKRAMDNIVHSYYLSHLKEVFDNVKALTLKTDNQCLSLKNMSTDSERQAYWNEMKELWTAAMQAYHKVELFKVGPAGEENTRIASDIYSWPSTSSCGVDIEVLSAGQELSGQDNRKGLDALEYLLFEDRLKHSCSKRNRKIKLLEKWEGQPAFVKMQQRCSYVNKVAEQVAEDVLLVAQLWTRNNEAMVKTYSQKRNEVLQEIFESLLNFTDGQLKDERLGAPSGLSRRLCFRKKCPNKAEHKYSGQSLLALRQNYQGLMDFFVGTSNLESDKEGVGFYHVVTSYGAESLAKKMLNKIHTAYCQVQNVDASESVRSLSKKMKVSECEKTTSSSRVDPLCALYSDSKIVSDLVKVDLRLKLSLQAPSQGGGDSD